MKLAVALSLVALVAVAFAGTAVVPLKVTLVTKDASHPYYNQAGGISTGYAVNGVQGAALTLSSGRTYTFDTTGIGSNHPLYITDSASGGAMGFTGALSLTDASNGLSLTDKSTNYNASFGGNNLIWAIPAGAYDGKTFYYQCNFHQYMGYKITIVASTFCEKYAAALGVDEPGLMDAAMTQIIGDLAADTTVGPFFKAQEPCCQTDFTNPTNFNALKAKLIAFFGPALGCNDMGFPAYTGNKDMAIVHKAMPIGIDEFNAFVASVKKSLITKGVSATDAAGVAAFIDTTFKPSVCNSVGCRTSICDRYSDLLHVKNSDLLGVVVDGTINKLVAADAPTKKYFDGSKGGTNFLTNSAALTTLRGKLIDFFWGPLGCTDDETHTYSGDLKAVHAPLGINQADQDFFIAAVGAVMADAGVAPTDVNAVKSVLASLNPQIVTGSTGPAIAATYNVVTVTKTAAHPQFGMGFVLGFTINGMEDPKLTLEVGKSYVFKSTAACIHPFYFADGAVGASVDGEITSGISSKDYTQVCGGTNDITWTINSDLVGKTIYYNCRVHGNMGTKVTICPAGGCTTNTICDKYSGAGTNAALLQTVVDGVVGKLVADGAPTKKYFDGTTPAGSTNYLAPSSAAALTALKSSIVDFFYGPLGCSKDTPGRQYQGRDLDLVHQPLGISQAEEDFFVQSVHNVLTGAGVSMADADAVSGVVHSLDPKIVKSTSSTTGPTTPPTNPGPNSNTAAAVMAALGLAAGVAAGIAYLL